MKKMSDLLQKKHSSLFNYKKTDEFKFFKSQKHLLRELKYQYVLKSQSKQFDIICKNSIISAMFNKKTLDFVCKDLFSSIYLNSKLSPEEFLRYYHDRIVDLKSFYSTNIEIYIPFFSHTLNNIYTNSPLDLLKPPYSEVLNKMSGNFIDMFSTYNFHLFDSNFTKLVKIKSYDSITAFYDFDFGMLFFINDQGRLDYSLAIFDKWMEKINTSHLLQRLLPICDDYMENNMTKIIYDLYDGGFISKRMQNYIKDKLGLTDE